MLQVTKTRFERAEKKARELRPKVVHIGARYGVECSDRKSIAVVRFVAGWRGSSGLWAECSCKAGQGVGRRGEPLPCYHVAAAILFGKGAGEQPAPHVGAQSNGTFRIPRSAPPHTHKCGKCGELHECDEPPCEAIWELPCGVCDAQEADAIDWRASDDQQHWR